MSNGDTKKRMALKIEDAMVMSWCPHVKIGRAFSNLVLLKPRLAIFRQSLG